MQSKTIPVIYCVSTISIYLSILSYLIYSILFSSVLFFSFVFLSFLSVLFFFLYFSFFFSFLLLSIHVYLSIYLSIYMYSYLYLSLSLYLHLYLLCIYIYRLIARPTHSELLACTRGNDARPGEVCRLGTSYITRCSQRQRYPFRLLRFSWLHTQCFFGAMLYLVRRSGVRPQGDWPGEDQACSQPFQLVRPVHLFACRDSGHRR